MFKKIIYSLVAASFLTCATSCNDWLDLKPNNEQITDDFWQTKEDVESVVMSGYYYMRTCVPTFIKWGELRGGIFYTTGSENKLQNFDLTPSHSICKYASVYQVINAANSVLKYAPGICSIDNTYHNAMMMSHLCEAYFMRAYCYLILVKNYGSVPLILEPYVDDNESFDYPKATEAEILAQIKADVKVALESGAAKTTYEEDWQTKGRATKWALYALMADAALWSEDYDTCKEYCNLILNATDTFRPVFISNTYQWFEMFCYGNSNESIFELNWDYNKALETNNFAGLWAQSASSSLKFTKVAIEMMRNEIIEAVANGQSAEGRIGRSLLASCVPSNGIKSYESATDYYMWKYNGTDIQSTESGGRKNNDANFIIYRLSEVMMMLAQAETMTGNIPEAFKLVNRLRVRAGLKNYNEIADDDVDAISVITEQEMLEAILAEKAMEFLGEGKRWYDLLWYGRIANHKYREPFVAKVVQGNQTTNPSWITSVLTDENAWLLPLPQADIEHNSLLIQNPYYSSTK